MSNLGYIPSWQFSQDAQTNPALNPFVKFPEGMTQTTVQPVGPYYATNMNGHSVSLSGTGALGAEPVDQINAMLDSWWWKNRKLLMIGGIAALGLGIFGGISALRR